MLYDGLNVTDALAGKSKCRNTAIAEAFQYMKIIEGWGTGLPRLFRQCREMNLPEPKFKEFGDGIKVTVYRANGTKVGTNGPETDTNIDIEQKIIELISQDSKITQKTISEKLNISARTIKRMMAEMQENRRIVRIGSNRAGCWKVN